MSDQKPENAQAPYDFSDWEPDDEAGRRAVTETVRATLRKIADEPDALEYIGLEYSGIDSAVRDNLREAFRQFGEGFWSVSQDRLKWTSNNFEESDPVLIAISPGELAEQLIDDMYIAHDWPAATAREAMSKYERMLDAWQGAIDKARAELQRRRG